MHDHPKAHRAPVILLGMHRSGTTMMSRLLETLGLFQGSRLEENHEATFFMNVNKALMLRIHGHWDHPAPMREFLKLDEAAEVSLACLRRTVTSFRAIEYLGLGKMLRYRTMFGLTCPWGWKDPLTIFTLPLWLRIFEGAKLIQITRNGVDVAASLVAREQRLLARRRERLMYPRFGFASRGARHWLGYKGSARCLTMQGAFSLWEEYVAEAERQLQACDNDRYVVAYEQFVADPQEHLAAMAKFCGLECDDQAIRDSAREVEGGRACAFAGAPEHVQFYRQVRSSPWMVRYGYDQLGIARDEAARC